MVLNKMKLGKLIKQVSIKNSNLNYGIDNVRGLSIKKEFIDTKADMTGVSLKPYLIVKPNNFAYVPITSRNGNKITLGYNDSDNTYIVSSSYIVFEVVDENILNSKYLFMYFNRPEFDRYSRFNSWGSAREAFSWDDMCDIDIELPTIDVQKKFVEVYESLKENQKNYMNGLEELHRICVGFIENLRKEYELEEIGPYIVESNVKNRNNEIKLTQGIDVNLRFIPAKREAEDKESAKVVRTGQFAYNKVIKCNGTRLPIALRIGKDCIISGSYQVFEITNKGNILPEYLMMWLSRDETQRFCGFNSWGSTRDVFPFEELKKLKFPIPNIKIQESIVKLYNVYQSRKEINEKLQNEMNNICSILIKGSLEY